MSLLISAGTSLAKGVAGGIQYAKGNKLAKSAVRPQYQIPSSVEDYLNNAKSMAASNQLPGQTLLENKLGGATSSGIRNAREGASSSAGLMAGIAGIKGNEMNALTDIGIKGAEYQDLNKQRLQQALLKYGQYQDQQFETNQLNPYYEKTQAAQALKGAGLQNIMTGVEGLGGAAQIGSNEGMFSNKYLKAKRGGYSGGYNDWLNSQALSSTDLSLGYR